MKEFTEILLLTLSSDLADKFKASVDSLRWADTSFEVASDGEQAAESFRSSLPGTLIILDWNMGEIAIVHLLDKVLAENRLDSQPIIMVADDADDKMLGVCYEYRVASVHTADFEVEILAELIRTTAEREQGVATVRGAIEKAHQNIKSGKKAEAAGDLHDLVQQGLDHQHMLRCELAEIYIADDKWEKAKVLLEPVETDKQWTVRALHLLGRVRMKLGDFKGAVAVFEKAKLINPYNVDRLLALGQAFVSQNKFAEAQENFDEALDLEPENEAVVAASTTCKLIDGDINDALATMRQIKSPRSIASIFNTSAVLAMRNKEFQKGMKLYEMALKIIGDQEAEIAARLWFNKGIGYTRQKVKDQALAAFAKATELDPSFSKAGQYVAVLGGGPSSAQEEAAPVDDIQDDLFGDSADSSSVDTGIDLDGSSEMSLGLGDEDDDDDVFSLV